MFVIAGTAELNRPPFDLVEAEQELVGGFHTEYCSIRFALFFLAEFMNTITMSAIIVTLFLGGPRPRLRVPARLALAVLWFFAKLFVFLFVFVWFRATLPRFRYDQLMDLGWKRLIPAVPGLAAAHRRHPHRPGRGLEPGLRHRRRWPWCPRLVGPGCGPAPGPDGRRRPVRPIRSMTGPRRR